MSLNVLWMAFTLGCSEKENSSQFASASNPGNVDADGDGIVSSEDCDDSNPNDVGWVGDCDQDGVMAVDDCDDFDDLLGAQEDDGDCDGVMASEDCDDSNPLASDTSNDGDCDGAITSEDCDDSNPEVGDQSNDGDCDGAITSEDCDDSNPESNTMENDGDCDGVITSEDCDDSNPLASDTSNDGDCDGVITSEDCDDSNPEVGDQSNDGDCDGAITSEDCDDADPDLGNINTDGDCDGVLSSVDCDDGDSSVRFCQLDLDLGAGNILSTVLIPSGSFVMGSSASEVGRGEDESQHLVTLSNGFYASTTEVTQGMFFQLMGYQSHAGYPAFAGIGEDYPAYYSSWHMAAAFANKATEQHNQQYGSGFSTCYTCSGTDALVACVEVQNPYQCDGYRLLTEAEWEYAARAGTDHSFWTPSGGGSLLSGTQESCQEQVLSDGSSLSALALYCAYSDPCESDAVGSLLPNGFGLFDMHGNVMEWTHDYYMSFDSAAVIDPVSIPSSSYVVRGGHYCDPPGLLRAASRVEISASQFGGNARNAEIGFRIGRSAP